MPTQGELAGLYDSSINGNNGYHLTKLIELTSCCAWTSEARRSKAAIFYFSGGIQIWIPPSRDGLNRALPVRSGK